MTKLESELFESCHYLVDALARQHAESLLFCLFLEKTPLDPLQKKRVRKFRTELTKNQDQFLEKFGDWIKENN